MIEIIELVVAAEQLLRQVNRVLKPHGLLILSTPKFAFWPNRLRIFLGHLTQAEESHHRFFTPNVLRHRLRAAGLEAEPTAHITPAMGYSSLARRFAHGR